MMKKLLSLIMVLALFSAPLSALASFGQYRAVTVDHTKVPNTDQSNFPVLVNGVYSYLATVANGGKVQSSQGFDVGFYTSSDCSTGKMAWEQVGWSPTTGTVEYWVKNATLSHTTDTTFYMCYGDASITTDQSATTTVWDSNYKAVYHLPNGSTLTALDSTSNANNGTLNNSPSAVSGQIDGAATIQRGAGIDKDIQITNSSSINNTTNTITIETWFKRNNTAAIGSLFTHGTGGVGGYTFNVNAATTNSFNFIKQGVISLTVGAMAQDLNWHHIAVVGSGTGVVVYVDGAASAGTSANSSGMAGYTGDAFMVANQSSLNNTYNQDEVRLSDSARSADWIKTEYNNDSATSTFYTVGAETPIGGGSVIVPGPQLVMLQGSLVLLRGRLILGH